MPELFGRLLCLFGMHDLELTDVSYGFGFEGGISKLRCRRCGTIKTKVT